MTKRVLHQYLEAALPGDATTDDAFLIQRWLLDLNFESKIYAVHCHPDLEHDVRPAGSFSDAGSSSLTLYQHAIGSDAAERLNQLNTPLILRYHNITPAIFFSSTDPALARKMTLGRDQLVGLREQTRLALADSDYNAKELEELGFSKIAVQPIVLDERKYQFPLNQIIVNRFRSLGPTILFVGRLAPNKKQEDLIKLLYFYKRIEPDARLVLVGSHAPPGYARWLRELASSLELTESILFTEHVSAQDMVTYYQVADLFVSMSEHEGFGKPLIESMYFKLPIFAFAAAAVPYTMAGSGILFKEKNFEALAEAIDLFLSDDQLRQRVVSQQLTRVADFLEHNARANFHSLLSEIGLL